MMALIIACAVVNLYLLFCMWAIDRSEARMAKAIGKLEKEFEAIAKLLAAMLAEEPKEVETHEL